MPVGCYPCPRTPVTHVSRTNTLPQNTGRDWVKYLGSMYLTQFDRAIIPSRVLKNAVPSKVSQ